MLTAICVFLVVLAIVFFFISMIDVRSGVQVITLLLAIICTIMASDIVSNKLYEGYPTTVFMLKSHEVVEVVSCQPDTEDGLEKPGFLAIIKT